MTLVVNFAGGPGVGKSTITAHTFASLKWKGINCEIASEYAKELVWEGRTWVLKENQLYVTSKQLHKLLRLEDKVDVILTDCPLYIGLVYSEHIPGLSDVIRHFYEKFSNSNVFIKRVKEYNPLGRLQSKEEAIEKDSQLRSVMEGMRIPIDLEVEGTPASVPGVVDFVLSVLRKVNSSD